MGNLQEILGNFQKYFKKLLSSILQNFWNNLEECSKSNTQCDPVVLGLYFENHQKKFQKILNFFFLSNWH